MSNTVTPANVTGSVAVTPNSSDDTARVSTNDPTIPIATPIKMTYTEQFALECLAAAAKASKKQSS